MFFLFLFELNNKTNGKLLSFAFSLNFFELFSLIGTLNINTPYFFIFNYNLFILYFVAKSVYKLKIPVIVLFLILVAPFFRAIFLGERNSVIYLLFIYLIFLGFQNNKPPLLKVLIIGILSVLIFLVIQVFRLGISNITENFTDLFQSFLNYFLMPFNYSQYIISNINTFTFPGQTLYFLNGFFSNFHIYENQLELFISARNVILYQNIYSNPSFNNISFIGELIIEFNILTPFILMIYGLIIGVFYKNFRNLNLFSTMIYPFLFIAVFESGRINFFFNTNFIFGILYSVLTLFIMKLLSKRI
jgi:oligosaccharide repeat unit polymerase